jgi:hypothetical protein
MDTEIMDAFVPHTRCTQALRDRIELVAGVAGVKPTVLVRGCIEFMLDGIAKGEFRIEKNMPDSGSGAKIPEEAS